ncbi:baseplate assembly protein [Pseudomonas phage Noxifer]|uniref:Uncharacterized protein n=1 Tax=Pseudomonas phage Noxifer TaxID=2006684 RepID=A0A1Y0SXQ8_9CAUD|nr:baseplate assembly protein [Pseudomonas phage Noxifer]ARV77335.1 hypothetical protein NOXIFER_166 [Pseudomonas phage Noxifer]
MESVFKLYSIGYVAENKPRTDRHVNVMAVEDAGATDGEVTFNPQKETLKGTDKDGKQYDVVTTTDSTLNCEWLPSGSNRFTPPDVVRGELVEIFRMGDTDQYYWRCMGLRDNLRTLETVIYAFSATPTAGTGPLDLTRCYYLEISTHEGLVTFSTAQANGEPFLFTTQFNTKEGTFLLTDDIDNSFFLDCKERWWKMMNADGAFMEINKKKIAMKADEEISMTCGESTYVMKPADISMKSTRVHVDGGGTTWEQVGAGLTVSGPKYTFA